MSQNDIRYLTPINIEIKKDKYCRFKKSGHNINQYIARGKKRTNKDG